MEVDGVDEIYSTFSQLVLPFQIKIPPDGSYKKQIHPSVCQRLRLYFHFYPESGMLFSGILITEQYLILLKGNTVFKLH